MPRIRLAILAPAPPRKRLWQGGIAMAVLVLTFAALNASLPHDKRLTPQMVGLDFLPFYTAGTLVRGGMTDLLYDLNTVKALEQETAALNGLELGSRFGPFWNPPFYAWGFVSLSRMPYADALLTWTMVNVAALLCALVLLIRMLPKESDWRTTALVPLLVLVSMPFIQAISHGQNTFTSLLLVAMAASAWRQRRAIAGGIACGLLLYKPQLAAVLAVVMAFDLGWRVMLGMGGVAGTLIASTAMSMPGAIGEYLISLPRNLHAMQVEGTYAWERHVTFKSFFRLLFEGRGPGEIGWTVSLLTVAFAALVGAGLLLALVRSRGKRSFDDPWTGQSNSLRRDRLIAATIAASPLIMPFYFDYDLLLLSVPATLLAAELCARPVGATMSRRDQWLFGTWWALFLWLMVNPGVASTIGLNVTVILLTAVVTLLLARAIRRDDLERVAEPQRVEVTVRNRRRAAA
jgi:hypothetical protein